MADLNLENSSPATFKINYPDISRHHFLGPSPDTNRNIDQLPRKKTFAPSVSANIGRRRSTHSPTHSVDLINSPPRSSYSTNISIIFANVRNGRSVKQKRTGRIDECPQSIQRRDSVADHTDHHQILAPLSPQESIGNQVNDDDDDDSDENPLQDLEDAVNLPSPSMPSVTMHPIDESSDEWTGDDMFIPRSTRDRCTEKSAKRSALLERQILSSEFPIRQIYSPKASRFHSKITKTINSPSPQTKRPYKSPKSQLFDADEKIVYQGESEMREDSRNEQ